MLIQFNVIIYLERYNGRQNYVFKKLNKVINIFSTLPSSSENTDAFCIGVVSMCLFAIYKPYPHLSISTVFDPD